MKIIILPFIISLAFAIIFYIISFIFFLIKKYDFKKYRNPNDPKSPYNIFHTNEDDNRFNDFILSLAITLLSLPFSAIMGAIASLDTTQPMHSSEDPFAIVLQIFKSPGHMTALLVVLLFFEFLAIIIATRLLLHQSKNKRNISNIYWAICRGEVGQHSFSEKNLTQIETAIKNMYEADHLYKEYRKVQKNFGHIKMLRESVIYFILNMFLIIAASSQIPSPENFNYSAIIIVLAIIPSVILSIPCYLIVKYKNEKYKKILEDSFSELEFQYDKVVEHYA